MFVDYLDGCLTAYWQLLTLSLWLISLLFIAINTRKALRARAAIAALNKAGITGDAFERLKPNPRRNLVWLTFCCLISVAILYS